MAGAWIKMVAEGDVPKVVRGVECAVVISFRANPMKSVTKAEQQRRIQICFKIFETLRGDLGWSVPKIIDFLPVYLKCELDGVSYDPSTVREGWAPATTEAGLDVAPTPQEPKVLDDTQPNEILVGDGNQEGGTLATAAALAEEA